VTNQYVPLNDYVLVEVAASDPDSNDLVKPEGDEGLVQTGTVVDPGRHGKPEHLPDSQIKQQDFVEAGDTVEWVRFSGDGRTKKLNDGRRIAQIPFERLTMKESK